MEKQFYKLNKTANSLELDLSQFAGITGAATILGFVFFTNKSDILTFLYIKVSQGYQENTVILILVLLSSVVVYQVSGWCLDWIYDYFYPEKKRKNSELNQFIDLARKKWSSTNKIYKRRKNKKDVSIYKPTIEKVERDDVREYKEIRKKLSYSKVFRMIVIPFVILGILKIINNDLWLGVIALAAAMICLWISFNFRAEHSKRLYRWFISS